MNKQLAALVLVAAAVAGCGTTTSSGTTASGPGSNPSASPTTLTGSPDPMKPPGDASGTQVGTPRVLPTTPRATLPRSQKKVSLPWRFLKLTDGGKKVEIALQYGGCSSFSYVQVAQQSGAVQLTVWGAVPVSATAICPAFEAILTGTVTLSAPLGSRQLLHGAVSAGSLPHQ
jgi:hypothetical protein